jgi:hypothetical protein
MFLLNCVWKGLDFERRHLEKFLWYLFYRYLFTNVITLESAEKRNRVSRYEYVNTTQRNNFAYMKKESYLVI